MKNNEFMGIPPKFLSVREVARVYGLGISTIWRKSSAGEFPRPIKAGPGMTRWRYEELEAWAEDPLSWAAEKEGA